MRFAVAEDAAALRDAAQPLLDARATPALIRSAWPAGPDPGPAQPALPAQVRAVWRGLADIGVTGALVAEAHGGLGLDENALPPVLSRIGHSGLPVPAGETVAVTAPLLAAAGHPALPDVLSGAALVTAQLAAAAAAELPIPFGQTAASCAFTSAVSWRPLRCPRSTARGSWPGCGPGRPGECRLPGRPTPRPPGSAACSPPRRSWWASPSGCCP
jgi:alkylation response protein AidB-like acyl-CoA dehydrogenase